MDAPGIIASTVDRNNMESLLTPKGITVADLRKVLSAARPGVPIEVSVGVKDGPAHHTAQFEATEATLMTNIHGETKLFVSSCHSYEVIADGLSFGQIEQLIRRAESELPDQVGIASGVDARAIQAVSNIIGVDGVPTNDHLGAPCAGR